MEEEEFVYKEGGAVEKEEEFVEEEEEFVEEEVKKDVVKDEKDENELEDNWDALRRRCDDASAVWLKHVSWTYCFPFFLNCLNP